MSTTTMTMTEPLKPCDSSPCVNGGCFDNSNDFICICPDGYVGTLCEIAEGEFGLVISMI